MLEKLLQQQSETASESIAKLHGVQALFLYFFMILACNS
jgi:hypothetical protein